MLFTPADLLWICHYSVCISWSYLHLQIYPGSAFVHAVYVGVIYTYRFILDMLLFRVYMLVIFTLTDLSWICLCSRCICWCYFHLQVYPGSASVQGVYVGAIYNYRLPCFCCCSECICQWYLHLHIYPRSATVQDVYFGAIYTYIFILDVPLFRVYMLVLFTPIYLSWICHCWGCICLCRMNLSASALGQH